ncbi:hypothetical protein M899_1927 [Bacteriovorax sp. BSW11_IV]|uniref:hypothetical protein n=1 Tax=Bacteriovorax sp. BSW11_IV TaxID=1353529 RepID=UPI00038A55E7|nr:hypothetical protein [Bacteriovorax sp. BSW11_IV]EQC48513.1 hypothetical protein M899_1927 [Bacteriovorax sp. BSW11_IV]
MKFAMLIFCLLSFSSMADFFNKNIDSDFFIKLKDKHSAVFGRSWYPNIEASGLLGHLERENPRAFQQYLNLEKKIISWVQFLDSSENSDLFGKDLKQWRYKNEGCFALMVINVYENELKKYDEKNQVIFSYLLAHRPQSLFANNGMFYLKGAEVEGTRSFDSGSFLGHTYSRNMNAITRTFSDFMDFIFSSGENTKNIVNLYEQRCDELPLASDFFPNWDMEEIEQIASIDDDQIRANELRVFMDSAWSPRMNFRYGYRQALALYPHLGLKFSAKVESAQFIRTYFDVMVKIYDEHKVVDEKLCRALNAPLSLASTLGFDVDPLNNLYKKMTIEDFKKWMEIKASINMASMYEIDECLGTLRYIDNVWSGSTILPHPNNSIMRRDIRYYLGKIETELFYHPSWKATVCMKTKLKKNDKSLSVTKAKSPGVFGCF